MILQEPVVKMVQGRGNVDNTIMDMLRQISTRLDLVETTQRRVVHLDDSSDDEVVVASNHELEIQEDEERLLRVLSRENYKPFVEVASYDEKLDTNPLLDWISKMEKFFQYEGTSNNKKVKKKVTKLKGHTFLWWENLQIDRQRREKRRSRLG